MLGQCGWRVGLVVSDVEATMARDLRAAAVVLRAEEREALQRLVRRRGTEQAVVIRACIVLAADAEPE